jgi:uncharacterized protein YkwD
MRWWPLLLAIAATAGCGEGGGAAPDETPAVAGSVELAYPNGHPLSTSSDDTTGLGFENQILQLTNEHRVARGLNALVDSPALRDLSRAHSRHMIEHAFFDHVNPEADAPWDRATKAGVEWGAFGENIGAGQATPQAVFAAWLASPGHRANLEDPAWTQTGAGYAFDASSFYRHYWTQSFMRPGSADGK